MMEGKLRNELRARTLEGRRKFIQKALRGAIFTAPVMVSFSAGTLVRANSCPGYGHCGKSSSGLAM